MLLLYFHLMFILVQSVGINSKCRIQLWMKILWADFFLEQ